MMGYDGPIYMTYPTKAICPILLEDYRKITVERKGETNFFTSAVRTAADTSMMGGPHGDGAAGVVLVQGASRPRVPTLPTIRGMLSLSLSFSPLLNKQQMIKKCMSKVVTVDLHQVPPPILLLTHQLAALRELEPLRCKGWPAH